MHDIRRCEQCCQSSVWCNSTADDLVMPYENTPIKPDRGVILGSLTCEEIGGPYLQLEVKLVVH